MRSLGDLVWLVIVPAVLVGALISLDLPLTLPVVPYVDGATALYLDRPYTNSLSNPALAGQRVVPVPRHLSFEVELELSAPAQVTRLLCERDDHTTFADWERVDALRIAVPGRSCSLTRAVTRGFGPGAVRLAPGGAVAAAPILVASAGEVRARTLQAWNKLTPAPDGSPLGLVLGNKRKLAGLALAYAGYAYALRRWRRPRA